MPHHSGRPHKFTFYGRVEPDIVMGERVLVRVPLKAPALSSLTHSIALRDFIRHVEEQYLQLMEQYGKDCERFELSFDPDKPGVCEVIFTRPMDRVEITQIRVYRGQIPPPPGDEAPSSASALEPQQPS